MRIVVVTGGARSGKSRWAQDRASGLGGDDVTVIATAEPNDVEMKVRIAEHRAVRPSVWRTIEKPLEGGKAVLEAATEIVVLECLTMLCANALLVGGPHEVSREVDELLRAATARDGSLLVVTNEVGLGVVPGNSAGREFRDVLGNANQRVAEHAEEVVLLVCGQPIRVK